MGELKRRGQIWWIRYYKNGRRYEESSGSTKDSDAKSLRRLREGDVESGVAITPKVGRIRFDEAAKDVVNDRTNRKRSLDDVERRIEMHLKPFFGNRRMAARDGTPRHVPEQRRTIAAVNVNAFRRTVVSFCRESMYSRMSAVVIDAAGRTASGRCASTARNCSRSKNPTRTLCAVSESTSPRQLTIDLGVRDGAQADVQPRHPGAATFAYITGWRIDSEVLPLEWGQGDFGASEVRLDPGKTKNGEGRTFPMTRELRELLDRQRTMTENLQRQLKVVCPRVFHRSGRPIKSFRVAFRTACAAAGCPGRVLHDFRRTAVRNLVRAGIPERVAMRMTGHETRSVLSDTIS